MNDLKAFTDFYFKLHDAIIPADSLVGEQAVLIRALEAWKVKRLLDRWIDRQKEEDWLILAAGAVRPPSFWRLKLRRPGLSVPDWTVTVSVWLRWGRAPGMSRRQAAQENDRPDRPRMHTMVSVHSNGPSRPAETPEPERTKPECDTSQRGSKNMSIPGDRHPYLLAGYELADRLIRWFRGWGKQTKPESLRKETACKNISKTLGWLGSALSSLLRRASTARGSVADLHRKELEADREAPPISTPGEKCRLK